MARIASLEAIKENAKELVGTTLFMDDMLASVSYFLDLNAGIGFIDVVDHLCNRRVKGAGELLQDSFRSGMNKLVNAVKESGTKYASLTAYEYSVLDVNSLNVKKLFVVYSDCIT